MSMNVACACWETKLTATHVCAGKRWMQFRHGAVASFAGYISYITGVIVLPTQTMPLFWPGQIPPKKKHRFAAHLRSLPRMGPIYGTPAKRLLGRGASLIYMQYLFKTAFQSNSHPTIFVDFRMKYVSDGRSDK